MIWHRTQNFNDSKYVKQANELIAYIMNLYYKKDKLHVSENIFFYFERERVREREREIERKREREREERERKREEREREKSLLVRGNQKGPFCLVCIKFIHFTSFLCKEIVNFIHLLRIINEDIDCLLVLPDSYFCICTFLVIINIILNTSHLINIQNNNTRSNKFR